MRKPDLDEQLPVYSIHTQSALEWDHDSDLTTPGLFHSAKGMGMLYPTNNLTSHLFSQKLPIFLPQ